jgi:hypothetical protein
METPSPKQQPDKTRFVAPSLLPSPEQPSPRRLAVGVTLLLVGFVAIFFAGSGALGQMLLIGGSILAIVSLFIFRPCFRIRFPGAMTGMTCANSMARTRPNQTREKPPHPLT